jgi:hypothetical protein
MIAQLTTTLRGPSAVADATEAHQIAATGSTPTSAQKKLDIYLSILSIINVGKTQRNR